MRPTRIVVVAAAGLFLAGCFNPVQPPGTGDEADASTSPGPDAGGACAKDSDCPGPVSPDPICNPLVAVCDHGTCRALPVPRPWDGRPGACDFAEQCDCQGLPAPDCVGYWECNQGTCGYQCASLCENDLQCPSGQNCFADCDGMKACKEGCRDSTGCPVGKICLLVGPACGDAIGACETAPSCTVDAQCPAGTVCDYPDIGSGGMACVAGCREDTQCGADQSCVYTACYNCPNCPCRGECQPKAGCKFDTQCAQGEVCATSPARCELHCMPGCRDAADCRPGQECSVPKCMGCGCDHGTCYDVQPSCTSDSDCAAGEVCAPEDPMGCGGASRCVSGCFDDTDCGADSACVRASCGPCCPGVCMAVPNGCLSDAECGSGEVCEGCDPSGAKSCVQGCRDVSDCKDGQICSQVYCGMCPCPAQCFDAPQGCTYDYECGLGMVCEPGPGCTTPNQCVAGCHESSQCANGGTCVFALDCLTCPCPGYCDVPTCASGQPCASGLDCIWGASECVNGCCDTCPIPVPPSCPASQCGYAGGVDVNGCDEGQVCGNCCKCAPGTPVCAQNYRTYSSECEATCAGQQILHYGACQAYEGLGCMGWDGTDICAAGQYCRDPCPMCGSIQQLRCTQIGACAQSWDCPAGLGSVTCPGGLAPTWACQNHSCVAACPVP